MMSLAIPTIHLNGTSRDELLKQQIEAIRAIRLATLALAAAAPNARDYYVQGNAAADIAREQHTARVAKLWEVIKELETIAESISK